MRRIEFLLLCAITASYSAFAQTESISPRQCSGPVSLLSPAAPIDSCQSIRELQTTSTPAAIRRVIAERIVLSGDSWSRYYVLTDYLGLAGGLWSDWGSSDEARLRHAEEWIKAAPLEPLQWRPYKPGVRYRSALTENEVRCLLSSTTIAAIIRNGMGEQTAAKRLRAKIEKVLDGLYPPSVGEDGLEPTIAYESGACVRLHLDLSDLYHRCNVGLCQSEGAFDQQVSTKGDKHFKVRDFPALSFWDSFQQAMLEASLRTPFMGEMDDENPYAELGIRFLLLSRKAMLKSANRNGWSIRTDIRVAALSLLEPFRDEKAFLDPQGYRGYLQRRAAAGPWCPEIMSPYLVACYEIMKDVQFSGERENPTSVAMGQRMLALKDQLTTQALAEALAYEGRIGMGNRNGQF